MTMSALAIPAHASIPTALNIELTRSRRFMMNLSFDLKNRTN
jgi:hypothetical protein